jgi:uncharacterized membrane protein YfcA
MYAATCGDRGFYTPSPHILGLKRFSIEEPFVIGVVKDSRAKQQTVWGVQPLLIVAIILIFAVVQSLFGVGLLVFGTPTLLLLGYPFAQTLAILLPASIAVSLLQTWSSGGQSIAFARQFGLWCLVPLATSLALALALDLHTSLNLLVALMLASFAALRMFPKAGYIAKDWVAKHSPAWLVLMGLVHGLSNLGGALLTIFAASRHRQKEEIRSLIAFCYACFAAIQLGVLALFSPGLFGWQQLGYAAIAATMFGLVGQHIFRWVSAPIFDRLLTTFIAAYAALLGMRSFGWI